MRTNEINLGMECAVTVLTTGFWPTYKVDEVALPMELLKCVDTVSLRAIASLSPFLWRKISIHFASLLACVCTRVVTF